MDCTAKKTNFEIKNLEPTIFKAIVIVFKKELTIFFRYPSWFISSIIWPILFPLGYIFTAKALAGLGNDSLSSFAELSGTSDYTSYMIIGTTMWMWINAMLWSFGTSLRTEQIRGTLESNWLCPVPKISLLLGYSLFQLFNSVIFMLISVIEFKLVYNFKFTGSPLLAAAVVLISVPSIYGIGFIFASLVMWAKETDAMVFLVRGIMTVFCGITYPLAVLPEWMESVSKFIPLTYSIRSLRLVISSGASINEIKNDILILLASGAILMACGILSFYHTQKKVKETGSLGLY